ncbi:MAG: hypothetical protein WCO56_26225 [Verrucomicrobiota bacterium]
MSKIAIDTNVFLHLTNPQENPDSHIEQLLIHLAKLNYKLCIDSTKKISNEYEEKLVPMIRNANEIGFVSYLLKLWLNTDIRIEVELDADDQLMRKIREVIREIDEHADRAFVYVACRGDCYLITNDVIHIIGRRRDLRSETRRLRGQTTDFIKSSTAVQLLVAPTLNQNA